MNSLDGFKHVSSWLLNSGIQSKEGGFFSWFDLETREYSYLYSEITGYGITTLLFLYQESSEALYLERARLAGDWLITHAMHPCGGVRTRLYREDSSAPAAYSFTAENIFSFDTGMALFGMANLYRLTQDKKYLLSACKMADFLVDTMQAEDGFLYPIYNAKAGNTVTNTEKWSNQHSSFHAKVAMGFVDLYEATQDARYKNAALKLAEFALTCQAEDGRFITDSATRTTHLHPHCYSAEGLLYVGSHVGEPRFIIASRRATEWALGKVGTGGINELYDPNTDSFNAFTRCDVLAQLLRLGLFYSKDKKIEMLHKALSDHQYKSASRQGGGFLYNLSTKHLNSWCSMFALQALCWYAHKDEDDLFAQPSLLI